MSEYKLIKIDQPDQLIQIKLNISVFLLNQSGNILIPYFAGSNICHKSWQASFCLQSTVIECLLNVIYWTPQLCGGRGD